ncbi:MAG: hypothetical protein FRX49_06017 [Trebouxia sp. A1-2]|nr:MAG: hypothetical protein FRX49_06017 [Trebouxia sp. A1-2]
MQLQLQPLAAAHQVPATAVAATAPSETSQQEHIVATSSVLGLWFNQCQHYESDILITTLQTGTHQGHLLVGSWIYFVGFYPRPDVLLLLLLLFLSTCSIEPHLLQS